MRKIIIFDLDNTFYNYQNSHSSALRAVFSFQNEFDDYKEFFIKYEEDLQFKCLSSMFA